MTWWVATAASETRLLDDPGIVDDCKQTSGIAKSRHYSQIQSDVLLLETGLFLYRLCSLGWAGCIRALRHQSACLSSAAVSGSSRLTVDLGGRNECRGMSPRPLGDALRDGLLCSKDGKDQTGRDQNLVNNWREKEETKRVDSESQIAQSEDGDYRS